MTNALGSGAGGKSMIIFDESHNETWTVEPLIAFSNSSSRPEYYSYEHLADVLRRGLNYEIRRNRHAPITKDAIKQASLLVIVHPADPTVHAGVGGDADFADEEINAIESFVRDGGALLVLYEWDAGRWQSNINVLLDRFGMHFQDDTAYAALEMPNGRYGTTSFSTDEFGAHAVAENISRISYHAGCTVGTAATVDSSMHPIVFAPDGRQLLAVAASVGRGRVIAMGDTDLFALPYIRQHDNLSFFLNVVHWLATGKKVNLGLIPNQELQTIRRPSVFLSYARTDHQSVKLIYDGLRVLGYDVWLDTQVILPGQRFEDKIYQAIREADFFLPCISVNSVNRRGFIQRELRLAWDVAQGLLDDDIFIIPVRLDDSPVHERFAELQWVDLFQADGLQRLLAALELGVKQRLRDR